MNTVRVTLRGYKKPLLLQWSNRGDDSRYHPVIILNVFRQTSYNAGLRLYLNSLEKQSVQKLPGEVGRLHLAGFTAPPAL